MELLSSLLGRKKINKLQYDTYVLFELDELGRAFLKNMQKWILTEEPVMSNIGLAWQEGRRSCWREVTATIEGINHLLKTESLTDGSSGS